MSQSFTEFKGHPVRQTSYNGRTVRYVAGQLWVKLKAPYRENDEAQARILKVLPEDSSIQSGPNKLGWVVIHLPDNADVIEIVARLKSQKEVESAEPHLLESAL
ncbi:MAG: hypothetical protein WAR21_03765 [Candidatus Acidiferrales bacterium]